MATAYSDPSSDITFTWSSGVTPAYSRINSGTRQPTAGDSTTNILDGDGGQECEVGMSNPSITGTISAVTVWLYCRDRNSADPSEFIISCRPKIGGSYLSSQDIAINSSSYVWKSTTWSGLSITAATAFTGAALEMISDPALGGPTDVRVGDAYLEITYTASANNYSETGSGGAVAGGTATVAATYKPTPSGGGVLNSTAPVLIFCPITGSGGGVVNGSSYNITAEGGTGGAVLNSTAFVSQRSTNTGSGGAVCGGEAGIDLNDVIEEAGSGGAVGGGTTPFGQAWTITGSGGAVAGGTATNFYLARATATGGATGNGGSKKGFHCADCGCTPRFLFDGFWDDDILLVAHEADEGGFWNTGLTFQIINGSLSSTTDGVDDFATLDAGVDDYTIRATVVPGPTSPGEVSIVFRYLNASNYWRATYEHDVAAFRLLEVTGGLETQKAFDVLSLTSATPYTFTVTAKDDQITADLGTASIGATATSFLTQTFVGIHINGTAPDTTVDDFCVTTVVNFVSTFGGALAEGTASVGVVSPIIGTGGVVCEGKASTSSPFDEDGEGGAVCGGTANDDLRFGTTPTGGALAGGSATIVTKWGDVASGGAVLNSTASVAKLTPILGSGGAVIVAPSFANGFAFRKTITKPASVNATNFPLPITLHVDEALTITDVAATDLVGTVLPSEFVGVHNGKLWCVVRCNLSALTSTSVVVYYGGV